MTYPEKIKAVRESLLVTQEELAKELGVTPITICRWETGKVEPSIKAKKAFRDLCEKKGLTFEEWYVFNWRINLDQIIARINKIYDNASKGLNEIVDSLSKDVALQDNVRKSANKEKVNEKVSAKLTEKIIETALNGNDIDKANFYTALSNDLAITFKICSLVIQNIKTRLINFYGV